jgi:hypothetical protein
MTPCSVASVYAPVRYAAQRDSIVLKETRNDDIDADRLATRMFDNDGDKWLIISLTEAATTVLTYNRLMNSITRTPIETTIWMAMRVGTSTAKDREASV